MATASAAGARTAAGRTAVQPTAGRLTESPWLIGVCVFVLLAVVALRLAEPIEDTDLFWHMAYAKQMLVRHTLTLDHTAFSWTPASNRMIYCAWASELFLYWLWEHFGMVSMFVVRYVCIVSVLALLWNYSRKLGFARSPVTWLILILVLLGSVAGTLIKPEIFSLLLFAAVVGTYFYTKSSARSGWLYLVPLLLAVWVNVHGAFIMVAPFLAATAVGEALNRKLERHMLTAWSLCGVSVLLSPYGWHYPWQLFEDYVLMRTPRPDVGWNSAHMSIFAASGLHFVAYMVLMAAILVGLGVLSRKLDWAIVLVNLAYLPLFMIYLRTTYFWPVVFGYSALYLARFAGRGRESTSSGLSGITGQGWLAVTLTLCLLGGRACYEAWRYPGTGSWMGFGINYTSPVPEAEFLASANLGPRMYNIFDSGGYLLWRLDPQYKVMTDSRSFPYLSWFDNQYKFAMGTSFDFVDRNPADVAVIDHLKVATWRNFLRSPEWRPVFYGPTAAVFVKNTSTYTGKLTASVGHLRNAGTAFYVFAFACEAGDYKTAWAVLDQLENQLSYFASPDSLDAARAYRAARQALEAGDWERAKSMFDRAFLNAKPGDRDQAIIGLLDKISSARVKGLNVADYEDDLRKMVGTQ